MSSEPYRTSWAHILEDEWPPPVQVAPAQAYKKLGPLMEFPINVDPALVSSRLDHGPLSGVEGDTAPYEETWPLPRNAVVEYVNSSDGFYREEGTLQDVHALHAHRTSYYRVETQLTGARRLFILPTPTVRQTLAVGYRLPADQEVPGSYPQEMYTPLTQGVNEVLSQVQEAHNRISAEQTSRLLNQHPRAEYPIVQDGVVVGQLPTSPAPTRALRDIYTQERIESLAFDSPLLGLLPRAEPRSLEELDALPGRNNVYPEPEVAIGHTERMMTCQRTLETLDRLLAPSWDRVWTGQDVLPVSVEVLVAQLHTLRADLQRWLRLEQAERTARVP